MLLITHPLLFLVASPQGLEVTRRQPESIDLYSAFEQWWYAENGQVADLRNLPSAENRYPFGWSFLPEQITGPTVLGVFNSSDQSSITTIKGVLRHLSRTLKLPVLADVKAALAV